MQVSLHTVQVRRKQAATLAPLLDSGQAAQFATSLNAMQEQQCGDTIWRGPVLGLILMGDTATGAGTSHAVVVTDIISRPPQERTR